MIKRLAVGIISVLFATCLGSATAFASDLETGSAESLQKAEMQSQQVSSATKTVKLNLLTSATTNASRSEFAYTKGLLKKTKKVGVSKTTTVSYGYKNGRMSSFYAKNSEGLTSKSGKFSYDKKGRLIKIGKTSDGVKYSYSYDGKGRVSQQTTQGAYGTTTYSFQYNKQNRLKQWDTGQYKTKVTYDSNGNIKTRKYYSKSNGKYKLVSTWKYKYTYKNGLVKKRVITRNGFGSIATETTKFNYKSVSVPEQYASLVKAQQGGLVNDMQTETSVVFPIRERISDLS